MRGVFSVKWGFTTTGRVVLCVGEEGDAMLMLMLMLVFGRWWRAHARDLNLSTRRIAEAQTLVMLGGLAERAMVDSVEM